jgi:hypothetical protein
LLINFLAELFALEIGMLLQPSVGFHNLVWIGSSRQDLCYQRIRIQCDRRYQLLQLFWRLWRRLNWRLWGGLVRLSGETSRRTGEEKAT